MRNFVVARLLLPLRNYFMAGMAAELAATRAQLRELDAKLFALRGDLRDLQDMRKVAPNIEAALLTLTLQLDEAKKPQPSSRILQRPSA